MTRKGKYHWSADGTYLPPIDSYSKPKHLVLQEYVKNWIKVLCGHGKFGAKKVTLIDGFCGGGIYKDKHELWEGSAIRMIRMVEEGLKLVQESKPWHKLDAEFIFIDNEKEHTECLKLQIRNAGLEHYLDSGKCKILNNDFEKELPFCIEQVKKRKGYSFWFLDPYGLDVSPEIVKPVITLGRSEILFTHMLSGLVRILHRKDRIHKNTLEKFSVDEYYQDLADQEDFLAEQAYLRNQGLYLYRQEGSVQYAWTFAIMKNLRTVYYYLIHLSSNPTALDVMKSTLWEYNNLEYQFHYGVYGLGFYTVDDYKENQLTIYDIDTVNEEICLQDLRKQIIPVLYEYNDGITLKQLHLQSMQRNPATKEQYIKLIANDNEFEVIRNGRITPAKKLKSDDIITIAKRKQLWIPGLKI